MRCRKVTTAVPSSSVASTAIQQPASPPVVAAAAAITDPDNPDWTYDPNEPRYCICNQVSYGDMVACDNSDVSVEFWLNVLFFRWLDCNYDNLVFFSVHSSGSTIRALESPRHQKANGTVPNVRLLWRGEGGERTDRPTLSYNAITNNTRKQHSSLSPRNCPLSVNIVKFPRALILYEFLNCRLYCSGPHDSTLFSYFVE